MKITETRIADTTSTEPCLPWCVLFCVSVILLQPLLSESSLRGILLVTSGKELNPIIEECAVCRMFNIPADRGTKFDPSSCHYIFFFKFYNVNCSKE